MYRIITRLLALFLFCLFHPDGAGAQQGDRPLNLKLGDAVVTGFSGTLRSEPAQPGARNRAPNDFTFINPDGPSVRVVDVSRPGYVWDGRLFAAPKTFDVFAKDVGQVFGVALDDSAQPNIYVAATSVFGLNIVVRGRDGKPERRKKGAPGAGWMKGQFGLDLQGGPGAIYKIDGRTGVPTLFANVTLNGVSNPASGLGNLAYDSEHKQLFVSDLHTGMIHRFALDGKELGAFDHGVSGLGAAKLAAVPFNPANRPNIASDRFDSEKPDTWGFAPAARRVWGLAVHEGRLYYSVVAGPQIWSVGIERDGGFAADPRWELDVPAQAGPLPVSDIAFSQKGAMILAQRALTAGAYDYSAFTRPGEPQVFRVWLKGPNDPPSPSRWKLTPEEYAVGYAGNNRNSNGGVALGYGYDQAGTLQPGSCEAALWITGQNLRNNPALRSQLEPGGPLLVHGLQGIPVDMIRRGSEPPATSYFTDYDDKFDDPRASGHIGSVRIFTTPCPAGSYAQPAAAVIPIVTPISCVGPNCRNACTPTCICPPGTVLQGKECVKTDICPPPMVPGPIPGQCICPPGYALHGKECVRIVSIAPPHSCRPPLVLDPLTGLCVPPKQECVPPLVLDPVTHTCVCPPGTVQQGRLCVPQICPPPLVPGPCECPEGSVLVDGTCIPTKPIDLMIEKTGGTTPYCPAPNYSFTIKVTNGPNPWPGTGNIVVTDTAPANMQFGPISALGWSCNGLSPPPGTSFTCTWNGGALTANQVLTPITIPAIALIGPPFPPFTNCASVAIPSSSGYADSNSANNNSCTTVSKPSSCDQDGSLSVTKKVAPDPRGIGNTLIFPMTVTCTNPNASYPLNVNGNTSTLPFNVPVGSNCSVTETLPPLPAGCTWLPPIFSPASVPIVPGLNHETVTNGYRCRQECSPPQIMNIDGICVNPPPVCTAPQVPNADGICACPAPMQPGAVPGQCICPLPNQMIGGACVPPQSPRAPQPQTTCPPPKVPDANGKCICPPTMMDKDGVCVAKPDACRPPKTLNPATGACECPAGTIDKGGQCVPPSPACVPPTHLNQLTGRCECAPGVVPGGTTPLIIKKILQPANIWQDSLWAFDLVCTGPAATNSSLIAWNHWGLGGVNTPVATCSQCSVTEQPRPVPQGACPSGTYATLLPPTYSPSSVVTGVGTDPAMGNANVITVTNNVVCTTTPPVCQPPLVLGPTGCECPSGQIVVGGRCVTPDDHKRTTPAQCQAGTKLIEDVCVSLPYCAPPQVSDADGLCGCPAPMLPGAVPGQCKCPQGSELAGGLCKPIVRKQPDKVKKPQACPEGTVRQGGKCEKRERKGVTGDDVRRGIDIIRGFPGSSGGGRGSNSGGGSSPGKR